MILIFDVGISCSRLSELALLYCRRIGSDALSEIGKGCQFLQAVHLVDCSAVGDDSIASIAKGCKNLKKLHIRRCYEVFFSFTSPHFQHIIFGSIVLTYKIRIAL